MKTQLKRTICFLIAAIMILSLAACGGGSSSSSAAPSGSAAPAPQQQTGGDPNYIKVNIAAPQDPGNYLPFNADNSVRNTYSCYFYEQLFQMRNTADGLVPCIATDYTREEDGTAGIYTVHIHDNVYDTAGEHITASDVAFCFNEILKNGERQNTYGELKPVEALDETTVRLTIDPDMLGTFERVTTATDIVSQKSYEASKTGFSSDPVGSGPYYIGEWIPGSSIQFLKNENYWAKDLGFDNQNCDEIFVKFIAEPAQATIEMETGGVDFAYHISTKDAANFEGVPGYAIINNPFTQIRCIGFNCDETNVFSDLRLRQAVCYAVDAEALVQAVYDGKGGAPTIGAVPEPEGGYTFDYDPKWKERDIPYAYNPEKAKELLADAGYPNGGLKVRLMTKDNPEYRSAAEIIQAYCAQVGIEIEINAIENALYQTYRFQPDAFDLQICQWANNSTPYIPCGYKWYMNRNPETGKNVMFQNDDEMQRRLEAALDFDTHSLETVGALIDYVTLDTCAMYPYAYTFNNYVHVDTLLDPVMANGIVFHPELSHYADTWARHS